MPVSPPNFDNINTGEINTFIAQAKEYYEANNNSFDGSDGAIYKTAIQLMISGLQAKVNENPATTMAEINVDYTNTEKEIEVAKSDLEAAKTRVDTLRKPDEQSYYESWFPINRPLKKSSIFIVLIIGIFLYILSFMILIRVTFSNKSSKKSI